MFFHDPWRPDDRSVITHAHGDHARAVQQRYLADDAGANVLRQRLGNITLDLLAYGERIDIDGVRVSLHPAGHVLGAAQVRIEHRGDVWVVSGDYKLEADPTCAPFEPLRCDTFITESTFGLPIYRWPQQREIFDGIDAWWRANAAAGRASVLYGYAFGKAQRMISGIDAGIGPVVCHGAVEALNDAYRASGGALPPTQRAIDVTDKRLLKRALVIAPPSAQSTPWLRRFGDFSDGFASGWMQLRGARKRRGVDRGFVLSDHADWPALLSAIDATRATRVIVTHGYTAVLVRWLEEHGLEAGAFQTEYGDDESDHVQEFAAAEEPDADAEIGADAVQP